MDDDDIEQLRQRKLQERFAAAQREQQLDAQKKFALKHILEPGAYERMMNVKLANPDLYDQVVALLVYLYQNKQLKGKVGDEQLLELLQKATGSRKETKIERR